jgi:hypothetical protein
MVYNVDGMENRQGKVTQYCWLKIRKGNEECKQDSSLLIQGRTASSLDTSSYLHSILKWTGSEDKY